MLIAEADAFVSQWKDWKLPDGRDRVVRHGHGPERAIQTGVGPVADILLTNRISAVPVVGSNGELVGIISEGDLIRRAETDTERPASWWLELLLGRAPLAAEYVKSHACKVPTS